MTHPTGSSSIVTPNTMALEPVPNPKLWTFDWCGGRLDAAPESCAHFVDGDRPIFDLASVTKVAVTGTLLADLFLESSDSLAQFFDQKILKEIPELAGTAAADITVGELWEHRSGLIAHRLLFSKQREVVALNDSDQRSKMWAHFIKEIQSETLKLPKITIYSDLGMLLLGLWLERVRGQNLSVLHESWKQKHGLSTTKDLRYGVRDSEILRVVMTEERHPAGQVNDDNCFCMGGIASHAGLFGGVKDLWAWLQALLEWSGRYPKLQEWLMPRPGIERFHAGWDTPSTDPTLPSQAGLGAPVGSIGHLGFTGTAVWWNLKTRQAGVLLSNRVRPSDSMQSRALIRQVRQEFFKNLWHNNALGEESWKAVLSV